MNEKEELLRRLRNEIVFKYYNSFIALFSYLIFKAKIEFVDASSTELGCYAFTDGEVIYIPKDVKQWPPNKIVTVVLHEILHLCRDDFERCNYVEDKELWNQISDAYINSWILKAGLGKESLPEYMITELDFINYLGENWTQTLTTEQAYRRLKKHGGRSFPFPKHDKSVRNCKVKTEKSSNRWKDIFASAVNMYGLESGDIQRIKNEIIGQTSLDLPAVLNKIFRNAIPEDYSHIVYDKVLWANYGLYLPDAIGFQKPKILFCIDVSGSIHVDEAKFFMNIAYSTMKKYHLTEADFLYFDSKIVKVEKNKKDFTEFAYTGGGTSYVQIFQYLLEHSYDLVVILTDGMGEYPAHKPSTHTVWAIPIGGYTEEAKQYGDVVIVPYEEKEGEKN